jgi:hypothetical protein
MLPIAAVASPTSTARLADLIAVHRVAQDAAVDAEASELTEPTDVRVFFLGREERPIGLGTLRERLTRGVELGFAMTKHTMSGWLSPELGEAALRDLEKGRADSLAQIEDAYANYEAAKGTVDEAEKVQEEAFLAVCAHRCASTQELTIKVRYLANRDCWLEPDQSVGLSQILGLPIIETKRFSCCAFSGLIHNSWD